MKRNNVGWWIGVLLIAMVGQGCERHASVRQPGRRYEEQVVSVGMTGVQKEQGLPGSGQTRDQAARRLSWTTPEGWREIPGRGMRLMTFVDQAQAVECSVVVLGPRAGEVRPNVVRWMRQLGIDPDEETLTRFLGDMTVWPLEEGSATVVDLTRLQQKEDDQVPSMIAVIIPWPDAVVFVKMTGPKGEVLKNKAAFMRLVKSLKRK